MPDSEELREQADSAESDAAKKAEDLREAADRQEESERKQEDAETHGEG